MSLFPFMSEQVESKNNDIYKEYEFGFNTNTLTGKILEGKEALKMWIYKALLTQRYIYPIYSWDYGQDLDELIGQGYDIDYIKSEVERRVKECLLVNERITGCHSFEINLISDTLHITFTAETTFGEVTINV